MGGGGGDSASKASKYVGSFGFAKDNIKIPARLPKFPVVWFGPGWSDLV